MIDLFIDGQTFDEFVVDTKTIFAVVKALEIIGEAAHHVSGDVQELDDTVDWKAIVALRHILVHEYYGIRPEILWRIITVHTVDLKPKLHVLIDQITEDL